MLLVQKDLTEYIEHCSSNSKCFSHCRLCSSFGHKLCKNYNFLKHISHLLSFCPLTPPTTRSAVELQFSFRVNRLEKDATMTWSCYFPQAVVIPQWWKEQQSLKKIIKWNKTFSYSGVQRELVLDVKPCHLHPSTWKGSQSWFGDISEPQWELWFITGENMKTKLSL